MQPIGWHLHNALLGSLIGAAALVVRPDQVQAENGVRQTGVIVQSIHREFLKLKPTTPFFSEYTDTCLSQEEGPGVIRYQPTEKPSQGPQPQQSSHISISYVPIEVKLQDKYWNVFEDSTACRFPALKSKIYGEILIWDDEKLAEKVKEVVIRKCGQAKGSVPK
jgi:hypothetical protein